MAKVCLPDGRTPAFDRPAQLLSDRLLDDLQQEARLTIIANRSQNRIAFGAFHCAHGIEDCITDRFRLRDVYDLPHAEKWVLADCDRGTCTPCSPDDYHHIALDPLTTRRYAAAPVIGGIAVLGEHTRFNGVAGVEVIYQGDCCQVHILGVGELCIYAERPVDIIRSNGSRRLAAGMQVVLCGPDETLQIM